MSHTALYPAMIATVINTTPSALIATDCHGSIIDAYISNQPRHKLQYLIGKSFIRLLQLSFGTESSRQLLSVWRQCFTTQSSLEISRYSRITCYGMAEYYNWRFDISPDYQTVIIYVRDITESVLVDEEFTAMAEQHEQVNRDLCVAMSNLDFHLMDLEQARRKLSALYRITAISQKTVNQQEVLEEILDGITRELGFSHAAILLLDEATQMLSIRAHRGYPSNVLIPIGKGICGHAALSRELIYVADTSADPRYIPGAGAPGVAEVAIPLIVDDRVIGVLDAESSPEKILQSYDLDMLRSLASQIAMTIEHTTHVCRVETEAITDGMTGLYNYRHFRTVLDREYRRAIRYNRPLTLIMLDIDHFKHYNDTNGHRLGDETLRNVANIIKESCRDVDFPVRYGGEEFAILLPETSIEEGRLIAERIRVTIASYAFANAQAQPGGALTASLGVAGYPNDSGSALELVDHADAALYHAKRTARNCVSTYRRYTDPL